RQKQNSFYPFCVAMASRRWKNYRSKGGLHKKETVEDFFENRACQRLRTPYNAPPLTRTNGKQAAGSAGFR
ncbi:hypothetical protein, partial [Riemerella anatipestifer]|uniref:hypothetical protein n=1 Tax=Riemerella anatipestifer TaxID=34085 RepID=UPI001BDACDB8